MELTNFTIVLGVLTAIMLCVIFGYVVFKNKQIKERMR